MVRIIRPEKQNSAKDLKSTCWHALSIGTGFLAGYFSGGRIIRPAGLSGPPRAGKSAPNTVQRLYFVPTVIFRWGPIKGPLLPPWAGQLSHFLTSIVDLDELALVLDSSHDSCIFLREKSEGI